MLEDGEAPRVRLTNHGELGAGGILVQGGVCDAGVHPRVVLRHVRDGQAVEIQD